MRQILIDTITKGITVGRRAENEAMQVIIDVSSLISTYGDGSATLMIKRARDTAAYPATTTRVDDTVVWVPTATDLAYAGTGEAELFWYVGTMLAKTVIWRFIVQRDIGEPGDAPDPYESWIQTLTELGAETLANAQTAEDAKDDAVTAKEAAETAAESAQADAEHTAADVQTVTAAVETAQEAAQTATEAVEAVTDAAYRAESSATAAATSAGAAEISATQAGLSANSAATSASDAEQSAQTAQEAVASIGDSVTRAESAASTATSAAQTASTKASEADTSAGTAAQNATTATVKAQEAAQSATQAAQSATAAQTAQTAAETAQTGAETAQTAAETAAASAEAQADRAEEYANRLTDFLPTDTASGSIASFSDGADGVEVKTATVEIEPVQDLHGYDNPWPAGGGKNLLNYADFSSSYRITSVTDNGDGSFTVVANENAAYIDHIINVVPNQTYCIKAESTTNVSGNASQMSVVLVYDGQTSDDPVLLNNAGILPQKTFTPTSNAILVRNKVTGGAGPGTGLIVKPQLEAGSTATAYAPYENICPISGWTGAKVTGAGANLFSVSIPTQATWARNITDAVAMMNTLPVGTYTLTVTNTITAVSSGQTPVDRVIGVWPRNTNISSQALNCRTSLTAAQITVGNTFTSTVTFSVDDSSKGKFTAFYIYSGDDKANVTSTFDVMLTYGSTATAYEPYSGETYDITFPSSAGTVYGGTLTYDGDGVWTLTSDIAYALLNDPDMWQAATGTIDFRYSQQFTDRKFYPNSYDGLTCSYIVVNVAGQNIQTARWAGATSPQFGLRWIDGTLEQVKADAAAGKIAICYELANPQTYTLTTEQVVTLLGQNNFFADCGDMSVTYRADIALFIDKKLAALAAALS